VGEVIGKSQLVTTGLGATFTAKTYDAFGRKKTDLLIDI